MLTAGHCIVGSGLSALWSHHENHLGPASVHSFENGSSADAGAIVIGETGPTDQVYGTGNNDIRKVTGLASELLPDRRLDRVSVRWYVRLGLRKDRRRRCRCQDRRKAHRAYVVDRFSFGFGRQRRAHPRFAGSRGRYRDRDDRDADRLHHRRWHRCGAEPPALHRSAVPVRPGRDRQGA